MNDTPEHIASKQVEIYLKMDPQKRFQIATEFIDMGIQIVRDRISSEQPGLTEKEITREFIREAYGIDVGGRSG